MAYVLVKKLPLSFLRIKSYVKILYVQNISSLSVIEAHISNVF